MERIHREALVSGRGPTNRSASPAAVRVCATILALGTGTLGVAQNFDYDPRRPAALRNCDDLRDRGRAAPARACYESLIGSRAGPLIRAEAAWGIGDVRRANEFFRAAVRADEHATRPRTRWGRLYLETHQYSDASGLFREALQIDGEDPDAKLGMARLLAEQFEGQARLQVVQLLEKDDTLIEAHLLAASMDLEENRLASAEHSLDRALELCATQQRSPLEAFELRAALELLRGNDTGGSWTERSLAYNPHFGGVFATLAHYEVMRRRYQEATGWLRRAIEVQPDLWSAYAELGVDLLRLGEVDEARQQLERAYRGDPFSATTVNTLRLLDTLKEFNLEHATAPDILMRLHRKEDKALRPYVEELARSSIATFSQRYAFQPRQPVTVELYPNHDDFAVRTAGLPGIGLLGVTFGYLVAMDSPSGRPTGDFHWGTTLWHEMAHVFTLSITDHRVPRWLSEGLSVFEEWRTGPVAGVVVSPRTLQVFHAGGFLPVATLDEGFIRPGYEDQIQVSYVQSGLVCLFVEQHWGFPRLVALLRQFTRDTNTAAAIDATFGIPSREFDAQFNTFVQQRFASMLAAPDEWRQTMRTAHEAAQAGNWSAVLAPARRAAEIFPEYTTGDSPYLLLARALDATGKRKEALQSLQRYRDLGGWDPSALRKLAEWLDEAGQPKQALETLHALLLVDPLDAALHANLGERLYAAGNGADSAREYRVLLALDAHDTAAANFGIARALHSTGDNAASRRYLLDALETAPHFRPAQDLLLELTGNPTP